MPGDTPDIDPMSSPELADEANRPSSSNSLHEDSSGAKAKSRTRTNFNWRQLHALEKYFHENHSPDLKTREEIGKDLQLTERTVRYWFQNRRQKIRELYKNTEGSTLGLLGTGTGERRTSESSTHTTPPQPQPPSRVHQYTHVAPPHAPHPYGEHRADLHEGSCIAYGPRSNYHTCCACMSELGYLIGQLHSVVPGIAPHAPPIDVLHATLAYVHAVQLAVGMRDTPRPYHSRDEAMQPWAGGNAQRGWDIQQEQQPPKWGPDSHSISPPSL